MTNFERLLRTKALIDFVQEEVLDLSGPHINHDIKVFKNRLSFLNWLNKGVEVDDYKGNGVLRKGSC